MMFTALIAVVMALALVLVFRPHLGLSALGRSFAFVALVLLPVIVGVLGAQHQMENAKQTKFCISCHVMELHGKSLIVDDDTILVAAHYQNGRIPREEACFTCHTTYTMFGDYGAKLRGLHHVWVQYVTGPPKEKDIRLYTPYHNRECLHCHEGTRKFEEGKIHRLEPGRMERIRRNELSCLAKGCHDTVHDVEDVGAEPAWKPPADSPLDGGTR